VEVSVKDLEEMAVRKKNSAKTLWIHDGGRQVDKSSCGRKTGKPCGRRRTSGEIMDMSFALQALSAKYVLENHSRLGKKVIDVPEEIDRRVALMKLESWGITIDELTRSRKNILTAGAKQALERINFGYEL